METQMNLETMGARTQVGEKLPLYEEYIKSAYQELTHLSKKEGAETVLVQHRGSGRIAVKKNVSVEAAGIYQALREFNHPNIVKKPVLSLKNISVERHWSLNWKMDYCRMKK